MTHVVPGGKRSSPSLPSAHMMDFHTVTAHLQHQQVHHSFSAAAALLDNDAGMPQDSAWGSSAARRSTNQPQPASTASFKAAMSPAPTTPPLMAPLPQLFRPTVAAPTPFSAQVQQTMGMGLGPASSPTRLHAPLSVRPSSVLAPHSAGTAQPAATVLDQERVQHAGLPSTPLPHTILSRSVSRIPKLGTVQTYNPITGVRTLGGTFSGGAVTNSSAPMGQNRACVAAAQQMQAAIAAQQQQQQVLSCLRASQQRSGAAIPADQHSSQMMHLYQHLITPSGSQPSPAAAYATHLMQARNAMSMHPSAQFQRNSVDLGQPLDLSNLAGAASGMTLDNWQCCAAPTSGQTSLTAAASSRHPSSDSLSCLSQEDAEGEEDLDELLECIGTDLARHGISVSTATEAGWLGRISPSSLAALSKAHTAETNRMQQCLSGGATFGASSFGSFPASCGPVQQSCFGGDIQGDAIQGDAIQGIPMPHMVKRISAADQQLDASEVLMSRGATLSLGSGGLGDSMCVGNGRWGLGSCPTSAFLGGEAASGRATAGWKWATVLNDDADAAAAAAAVLGFEQAGTPKLYHDAPTGPLSTLMSTQDSAGTRSLLSSLTASSLLSTFTGQTEGNTHEDAACPTAEDKLRAGEVGWGAQGARCVMGQERAHSAEALSARLANLSIGVGFV